MPGQAQVPSQTAVAWCRWEAPGLQRQWGELGGAEAEKHTQPLLCWVISICICSSRCYSQVKLRHTAGCVSLNPGHCHRTTFTAEGEGSWVGGNEVSGCAPCIACLEECSDRGRATATHCNHGLRAASAHAEEWAGEVLAH